MPVAGKSANQSEAFGGLALPSEAAAKWDSAPSGTASEGPSSTALECLCVPGIVRLLPVCKDMM